MWAHGRGIGWVQKKETEDRNSKPKGRVSDTALRLWWEISGGGEMTAQSFSVLPGILWSKVDYYYLHACALNSLSTS